MVRALRLHVVHLNWILSCSFASAGTRPQDCYIPQSWVTQGTVTLQTLTFAVHVTTWRYRHSGRLRNCLLGAIRTLLVSHSAFNIISL
jgi:hypothetical protein